ncbi:CRISPR system Cascade subunit CasE [Nocardia sp. GAS34]|uniref:type I-E CRISPR-associated protein Cas6/Cse3/CasE n=1 Tax=unclassified Nocardia TaxID=2637762 RepID=UPI003D1CEACD
MMYLSRIPLNPARRGTRKFLSSPQVIHAAVMLSFAPDALTRASNDGRVLWRLDQNPHHLHLYVVSPAEPDFTHIVEQAGWPTTGAWATRKYSQLLDQLAAGQRWHFRLTANPVGGTPGRSTEHLRGKRIGLKTADQLDWLRRKATDNGFRLAECGPDTLREDDVALIGRSTMQFGRDDADELALVDRSTVQFRRSKATVTLSVATYEGILTVTDSERLRAALINGIGRAKGYGCGLLTLAPVQ